MGLNEIVAWYPERDLNPHTLTARDFKSLVSTIPPSGHVQRAAYGVRRCCSGLFGGSWVFIQLAADHSRQLGAAFCASYPPNLQNRQTKFLVSSLSRPPAHPRPVAAELRQRCARP